jgi:hypothetical protein
MCHNASRQVHWDRVLAEVLDWFLEVDPTTVYLDPNFCKCLLNVLVRHRTKQLAFFPSPNLNFQSSPCQSLRERFRLLLLSLVSLSGYALLMFQHPTVASIRVYRKPTGKQIIPGEAWTYLHDLSTTTKIRDRFSQNDFHCLLSSAVCPAQPGALLRPPLP